MKSKPIVTTLTLDQRKDIKNAFDALDVSRSGTIELKDIKVALRALGFEPKKDEARMIIAELEKRSLDRGQLSKIQNGMLQLSHWPALQCRQCIARDIFRDHGV